MNDREVLQAMLDGKVILVKQGTWHSFRYKLIGDKIYIRFDEDEWEPTECIPELELDHLKIEEEEE